jgi:hypothetical protein
LNKKIVILDGQINLDETLSTGKGVTIMHGYYWGHGIYPLAIHNIAGINPQPEPPCSVAMATPLPIPPSVPHIMLAVASTSSAMGNPVPEPPNRLIFLGPQPEPPDKAFKRYKDYLAMLKEEAGQEKKYADEASIGVMLAVANQSGAMVTFMPIPPSMLIFLSPQPEPPDIAFKRYKDYLAILKMWSGLFEKCVDEALSLVEEFSQELKG